MFIFFVDVHVLFKFIFFYFIHLVYTFILYVHAVNLIWSVILLNVVCIFTETQGIEITEKGCRKNTLGFTDIPLFRQFVFPTTRYCATTDFILILNHQSFLELFVSLVQFLENHIHSKKKLNSD